MKKIENFKIIYNMCDPEVSPNFKFYPQFNNRGNKMKLECGPMPNLMVALPNIRGALCSMP